VQEIFEENKSKLLQGAIIWTSMLVTDSLNTAEQREAGFSDSRVMHFWDPGRILGRLLSQTLKLQESIAWDVYLVYSPHHLWDTELPPVPDFWMHPLDEDPALFLDPLRLNRTVQMMTNRVKHE
jgi:hypothetical protein